MESASDRTGPAGDQGGVASAPEGSPGIERALEMLQQALGLTMRCAVYYPRAQRFITDPARAAEFGALGSSMIAAADQLARVIGSQGHAPRWSIDCAPDDLAPPQLFSSELERVREVLALVRGARGAGVLAEADGALSGVETTFMDHLGAVEAIVASEGSSS